MIDVVHMDAQLKFIDQSESVTIVSHQRFQPPLPFDTPVDASDNPQVILFKTYFNPVSFAQYKSFFLDSDWGGFTEADFNSWQDRIHHEKLFLQQILDVRLSDGRPFYIFQYAMETPQHTILHSMVLKWTSAGWKHINLDRDHYVEILKKVGSIDADVLDHMISEGLTQKAIKDVPATSIRQPIEKFNRQVLSSRIQTTLLPLGIKQEDIVRAQSMFLDKRDHDLVYEMAGLYKLDPILLMEKLNEAFGFTLFQYSRS